MRRAFIAALGLITMVVLALLLFPLGAVSGAPAGNATDGKAFWNRYTSLWCLSCHGVNGEGGYGPDLAGRGLTFEQFQRAVRQPWGVMPAYTARQVSDQDIADMVAYFKTLPAVAAPGPWRTTVPSGAPLGERLLIETFGCAQCHGSSVGNPRQEAGRVGADFKWFEELVYEHTVEFTGGRMGDYSKARFPEETLKTLWTYLTQTVGLRVPVSAAVTAASTGSSTTYTLAIRNTGLVGKGFSADQLYLSLQVPANSTVTSATTEGYQGVQTYAAGGYDIAVWLVPRLAAGQKLTKAITVSGGGAAGGSGAFVRWLGPQVDGQSVLASVTAAPTTVERQSFASGGRLYDKWWTEQGAVSPPSGNQALWATQSTNTRTGGDSWRCKECHAWDYLGKDGAYASGSHKTGFAGVYDVRAKSAEALTAALKGATNAQHNFSALLSAQAIEDLVNFMRDGLIDDRDYIDYATKKVKVPVDLAAGNTQFNTTCASCHGRDGKGYNFGTAAAPEYIGTVAADNPQETLNKIRFGQPGTTMPSAVVSGWTIQQMLNVLSYAQTLPLR